MKRFIKYFISILTLIIAKFAPFLLFDRDFTRIVNMHNPTPNALDKILTRLNLLAPFTTYNEVIESIQKSNAMPSGFVITFDDGYKENMEILDVLDKHNCKAVFFISTGSLNTNKPLWFMNKKKPYLKHKEELKSLNYNDFLKRIDELGLTEEDKNHGRFGLNKEELKEIAKRGHNIGVHTINHAFLSKLTPEEVKYEIGESYATLKNYIEDAELPFDVAYPDGNYDENVVNVLKEMGCRSAVTIEHKDVIGKTSQEDENNIFKIGRYGAADNDLAGFALFKQSRIYRFLKS